MKNPKFEISKNRKFKNPKFEISKNRKFKNPKIQKSENSKIQNLENSKIQKFKIWKIQKFKIWKIQKFKMKGIDMSNLQTQNGVLEDISAEIGYTATTTLIDWLGGTSLYVPQVVSADHFIYKLIGQSAFKRLVMAYGNEVINLPIDYRRERTQRNRLIGALLARNADIDEIARLSGIGAKQIGHVRSELVEAGMLTVLKDSDELFLIEPSSVADFKEFEALVIIVGGVAYAKVE